eukprot:scaffold240886_cov42-Prasinocladus_malaysianus.AAC.1
MSDCACLESPSARPSLALWPSGRPEADTTSEAVRGLTKARGTDCWLFKTPTGALLGLLSVGKTGCDISETAGPRSTAARHSGRVLGPVSISPGDKRLVDG